MGCKLNWTRVLTIYVHLLRWTQGHRRSMFISKKLNIDELLVNTFRCLSVSLFCCRGLHCSDAENKSPTRSSFHLNKYSSASWQNKSKEKKTRNEHPIKAFSECIKSDQHEHLSSYTRGCGRELANIMCLKHNLLTYAKTSSYKHLLHCTLTYPKFRQPIADETQNVHEDTTKSSEFVATNSVDTL